MKTMFERSWVQKVDVQKQVKKRKGRRGAAMGTSSKATLHVIDIRHGLVQAAEECRGGVIHQKFTGEAAVRC